MNGRQVRRGAHKYQTQNNSNPNNLYSSKTVYSMLSHCVASNITAAIRAGCRRSIPASSIALSQAVSQCRNYSSRSQHPRFTTYTRGNNQISNRHPQVNCLRTSDSRLLSTHPICDHIDCNSSRDLSPEDFDSKFC